MMAKYTTRYGTQLSTKPLAICSKPSLTLNTGAPLLKISAAPRNMIMEAKVAMNGGMSPLATLNPLNAPIAAPTRTGARIATARACSPGWARLAAITPVKATMEPTDRSMPPDRITNIMPVARMPLMEACLMIPIRFWGRAKALGERTTSAATTARNMNTSPKSWKNLARVYFRRNASAMLDLVESRRQFHDPLLAEIPTLH